MKTQQLLLLIATSALAVGVSAQTLTGYGVIKNHYLDQTSASAPVDNSNPYGASAYVFGTGLSGTYSFTSPGGSATSPQSLTINGGQTQADFQSDTTTYLTTTALNLGYNDGVYSMALPNSNGVPQTANLPSFSGDAFPGAPTVGGTWSGGMLQVDPTQNYTLIFSAFSGFSSDDSISMNIDGVGTSFFSNTAVTSFTINAGTLTAGQSYSTSLRFNNNFIDYGTSISGANGNSGYTTEVDFQIQAIPEPSTYAAIIGAVALAGVILHRRRQCA